MECMMQIDIPTENVLEFFLECVPLLTPDKTALACSLPRILRLRESVIFFRIRLDRERGTLVKIKCFRSTPFGESPMAAIANVHELFPVNTISWQRIFTSENPIDHIDLKFKHIVIDVMQKHAEV